MSETPKGEKPKERKKLTYAETRVEKREEPLKISLPVGDDLEMDIEYNEVTGAVIESLELKARREALRDGEVDSILKEELLSPMIWDKVMVTYLGQPWSEKVRRSIRSKEYTVLNKFIMELVAGKQ